jgi:hypothetical protein
MKKIAAVSKRRRFGSRKKSVAASTKRGTYSRKKAGVGGKRKGDDGWKRNENVIRKLKRYDSG